MSESVFALYRVTSYGDTPVIDVAYGVRESAHCWWIKYDEPDADRPGRLARRHAKGEWFRTKAETIEHAAMVTEEEIDRRREQLAYSERRLANIRKLGEER